MKRGTGRGPDAVRSAATGLPGTSEGNAVPECETIPAGPDLELLAQLKEKNLAAQGLMVIEGRIAIEKALDAGIVPRFLVCTEAEEEYWRGRPAAFPVRAMSHEALCVLVDFKFHRGAIAIADLPKLAPFEGAGSRGAHGGQYAPPPADRSVRSGEETEPRKRVGPGEVREAADTAPREVFLCLWDVTDPSNLGALLRTAAGLGVAGALLGPGCASPYYRKTIRASMGNVFSIPVWSADLGALESLNRNGARLVAAALSEKALPLEELNLRPRRRGPLVLILGNEGYGLPAEVLDLCTDEVRILMARGVDSLNVAVAGGILMYELLDRI